MKVLLIVVALVAAAGASNFSELVLQEWETHKLTHNLKFQNAAEDRVRLITYVDNRIQIAKHNAKFARGEVGFTLAVNQFAHMTNEEFTATMNGYNRPARKGQPTRTAPRRSRYTFSPPRVQVPDEIDWREKGAVTQVKNQGTCGSCYAFSATGALEGQIFLKKNKSVSLSEQNIVDCSRNEGNQGCDGGLIDNSFQYVEDNNGIDTEQGYPYTAEEHPCQYSNSSKGATESGFVDIPRGDEEALRKAVATIGPISVGVDARGHIFQSYQGGVYNDPNCSSTDLDHGVLVVGYGTTSDGTDYWLVKNSWGPKWGEDGYIRMIRNHDNHCGIATSASYPLVK